MKNKQLFILEMKTNFGKILTRRFKDFASAQDCGDKYFNAIGWEFTIKEVKG